MRAPGHATVVAYLALFVALGGSAVAVSRIGSPEIENRSIKGKDVADDALGGRQVFEGKLSGPQAVGAETSAGCDPTPGAPADCIGETVRLKRQGALLVVATASKTAEQGSGSCSLVVDGAESSGQFLGGTQRDGLALTKVTAPLGPGRHAMALRCTETSGELSVDRPTIAAIAVESQP